MQRQRVVLCYDITNDLKREYPPKGMEEPS